MNKRSIIEATANHVAETREAFVKAMREQHALIVKEEKQLEVRLAETRRTRFALEASMRRNEVTP